MLKKSSWIAGLGLVCAAGFAAWYSFGWQTNKHNPDALWHIVHERCANGAKPCTIYDASHGFALLHSVEGRGQYLLIPSKKVPGIESADLLGPDAPNYFAQAWSFREYVSRSYGVSVPDRELSLAINSVAGRTQNQLHIHLDCLKPEVRRELDAMAGNFGPSWVDLPIRLEGHAYRGLYLSDLGRSPFQILAAEIAQPQMHMRDHTLVVAPLGTGFALLDDTAHGLDRASGEELQDHSCRDYVKPV
ncbi:CDP-diacylglycerol diphosphatase [Kozakia baliensis]|uniref:CDP-diacylglycerol diphosphatase n=1 Tax=Kozakia baliensis TaxID=153496 RepID=UPI00087DF209|nr:CDP-diacylglycerol diphosphatase [Kozakia baliensis]AOX19380.1 hypothetical protein A0U90_02695 [Kozakia baliensis]